MTFAREGARVFASIAMARRRKRRSKIIAARKGGKADAFAADASRAGRRRSHGGGLPDQAFYGHIDVLDNNVGIAEMGSVVDVSEASWDHVFAVNLKSAYLAMKHVIPVMARQGGGSIINISSIASIRHLGLSYVTYGATKAAMNQMTRTTAVEFALESIGPGELRAARADAKTPMVEHSAGLAASYANGDVEGDVARPRRADADGPYGAMPGTSSTPRCFSPPTDRNA